MGGIPYTAHGAQKNPTCTPLYFDFCLFFVFMLILGLVRLGKGYVFPAGLTLGPAGLGPPAGARKG